MFEAVEDFGDASDGDADMRADPLAAGAAPCSLKVAHRQLDEPKDLVQQLQGQSCSRAQ